MFTGLVQHRGRVASLDGARLVVEAPLDVRVGDSVSISGACLTVVESADGRVSFDVAEETFARTTLGGLGSGDQVNVETALRAGDPLGGHYVQGHVDGVGRIRSLEAEGDGVRMWIDAPELARYCVEKGSITVDGVSLTVAETDDNGFAVALIPHTLAQTTLGALSPGDPVNVEADVLAKYVERLLGRPLVR